MDVRTALGAAMAFALLAMSTLAHAGTDRDRWLQELDKYAVRVGTPRVATIVDAVRYAKAACICTETGSLARRPGLVVVGEGVDGLLTFCAIPSFDEHGSLEMAVGCSSFVPLAR
jgi:hypothetical protein